MAAPKLRALAASLAKQRSDARGLAQLALHAAVIAASGAVWAWAPSLMARLGGLALLSLAVGFLFMPFHEAIHSTPFRSPALNAALCWLAGLVIGRTPAHYRHYHFAHHRFTGDASRDPELANTVLDPAIESRAGFLLYLTGLPYWADRAASLARQALGVIDRDAEWYLAKPAPAAAAVRDARIFVAAYAAALALVPLPLLWRYWALPSLVGQAFLRFYLVHEHSGCLQRSRGSERGSTPEEAMLSTRTTIVGGDLPAPLAWLVQRLAWDMPYHAEHHAFPAVPFHKLRELHEASGGQSVAKSGCTPSGADGLLSANRAAWRRLAA